MTQSRSRTTRKELAPPAAQAVAEHLEAVRRRIETCGRDPAQVTIVAVTKGFSHAAVAAALAAGVSDIGENYADELLHKAAVVFATPDGTVSARWHYLGAIQRRRVRDLAPVVHCWQTVSRAAEAEAIAGRAGAAKVMVEVDTTGLPGRNGCSPSATPALVSVSRDLGLEVRGLMAMGPPGPPELSREAFRTTARLAAELGLPELSMGMSGDLEVALEEGATIVRVGRALFGERPAG
ncbi:MAG: YggS family pyridoxal phosphate enzyme [Acidimicrobiales bacterium]